MSETTLTEDVLRDLSRRLRGSDRTALSTLFRALYSDLYRYARSFLVDAMGAEDLVQEAFIRLWERRETIDRERSVRSYLFVTLRHSALNSIRQVQTRRRIRSGISPSEKPPQPDDDLAAETMEGRLTCWIEALPERRREAFELSRFAGLSLNEIAEVMRITPKTAENHVTQALRDLRSRLKEFDPDLLRL